LLPVTHEILGEMIATRRTTITQLIGELKSKGLISSSRGKVTIRSRRGLEKEACVCYGTTKALFTALYK
jgi:hypothetical protein